MPTNLFSLPRELSDQVLSHLELIDVCSLRLANKAHNEAIAPKFASRHLMTIHTDLSRTELQRLDRLADSQLVKDSVLSLCICNHRRSSKNRMASAIWGFEWNDGTFPHPAAKNTVAPTGWGYQWNYGTLPHPAANLLKSILLNKLTKCRFFDTACEVVGACSWAARASNNVSSPCAEKIGWVLCTLAESGVPLRQLSFKMHGDHSHINTPDMKLVQRWELTKRSSFQRCCRDLTQLVVTFCLRAENVQLLVSLIGHSRRFSSLTIQNDQSGRTLRYNPLVDLLTRLQLQGSLHSLSWFYIEVGESPLRYNDILLRRWKTWFADMPELGWLLIDDATMGLDGHWADLFACIAKSCPKLISVRLRHLSQATMKGTVPLDFPEIKKEAVLRAPQARPRERTFTLPIHVVGPRAGDLTFTVWCFNQDTYGISHRGLSEIGLKKENVAEGLEYLSIRENLHAV